MNWWYSFWDWADSDIVFGRIEMIVGITVCAGLVLFFLIMLYRYWLSLWSCDKGNHHWSVRTIGRHCERCGLSYKDYVKGEENKCNHIVEAYGKEKNV